MTRERFSYLLNHVIVQLVAPSKRGPAGLFVQGLSQEELAEIVTLAGQRLGEVSEEARVNPEWIAMGPAGNVHFMFHPEALKELEQPID